MGKPLIGVSSSIERIRELIRNVSDVCLNIIISGESGVGKEVVAQSLYYASPRNGKPFIKVNCAALPEGLLESELFGFERGAFTGAERKRRGKFELANSGVLFLDEIGDMPLPLQSKLLHVLQSGEFTPLGSEKDIKTDTWTIAATNHDLEKDIRSGRFREDLFYRLNIIKIHIPPLRERPEDIPPLTDYYLRQYAFKFENRSFLKPDRSILEKLVAYPWPGNVRELQNVLKRLFVAGSWDEIIAELENGPREIQDRPPLKKKDGIPLIISDLIDPRSDGGRNSNAFSLKRIKKKAVDKVEREVIAYVLNQTAWNRSKAAKILKVSYKTLLYKINDLDLHPPREFDEEQAIFSFPHRF